MTYVSSTNAAATGKVPTMATLADTDTDTDTDVNTDFQAKHAPGNLPDSRWQIFGEHDWQPSNITEGMYQTMVDIGDGIELCVEGGGNPEHPVIVMIMGLGSQLMFWPDSLLERLIGAGYFVIRFDNRDIGLSSKISNPETLNINRIKMMARMQAGLSNAEQPVAYTLHEMADDTVKLIEAFKLDQREQPPHLFGASMGGIIGQLVAATRPELVSKLILLFTTNNRAFLVPPKPRQLSTLIKRPAGQARQDIIKHSMWFIKTIGSPGFVDDAMVADKSELHFERGYYPLGSIQQLSAILATGSIRPFSRRIQAPTLVLHGSADGLVPPAHGKDVAKSIPDAKFVLIDGMGHDLADYYRPFLVSQIRQHLDA